MTPQFMDDVYRVMKNHVANQIITLIMEEKNSAFDPLLIKIVKWRDE